MNNSSSRVQKGFTLIELTIVIIILGVLASLISGNFLSSLKKGRDARRKADLQEIQKALEMYYEDYKEYPKSLPFGNSFAKGGKTYMQKLPKDPIDPTCRYRYLTDIDAPNYYYLLSPIENTLDQSYGVSQTGYKDPSTGLKLKCGSCDCKFYLSSPNATPLAPYTTPNPTP